MLRSLRPVLSAAFLSLSLLACARGATLGPPAGEGPGAGGGSAGAGGVAAWEPGEAGGGEAGGGAAGGGGEGPGERRAWDPPPVSAPGACSELTSHHIYLVTPYSEFFSFHPATSELRLIGELDCPILRDDDPRPQGVSPLSMAVDRTGVAWILDTNGYVVRLDISTGRCEQTSFRKKFLQSLRHFGMAFASDGVPGQETLYVREALLNGVTEEEPVRALAVFDTRRATLRPLGVGRGGDADLTGTGDGRLFGFVKGRPGEPALLGEYNKATGATRSETPLPGVTIHDSASWAFATWGGEFWLFASNPDPVDMITSSVHRFKPGSDAPPVLVRDDLPAQIIGAGVSTCAPTEVPL
ncbi:hypothetical protein [Sorangium sp. So ce1099]|uniref:hypothetical protein n=1 Tax=Sorangium sp. So ce1099 TaxID=3133331 RepID=UPI003F6044F4